MSQKTLEQMLEHLVNDDQDKAEELFHEYVVAKSREIYEGLIEVEEGDFEEEEVAEDDMDMMDMPADETGDLEDEISIDDEGEEEPEEEEEEESEEELFQELEDIVGELEAKFAELKGEEAPEEEEAEEAFEFEAAEQDDDEDTVEEAADDEDNVDESFEDELASLREYVEKVGGGAASSETTAENTTSVVDNMKNDMGGTTANILSDKTDEKGRTADKPKEEDLGNINKPGGMKSDKMMNKASGGAANSESGADNTDSVLRSKR